MSQEITGPQGPAYPLTSAFTRRFPSMEEAYEHFVRYQYVRCVIYPLTDGAAFMVVHA